MNDPFFVADESPADALNRACSILCFVRSWANAQHDSDFSENEMVGLSLVTEAAESLIHKAEKALRK